MQACKRWINRAYAIAIVLGVLAMALIVGAVLASPLLFVMLAKR